MFIDFGNVPKQRDFVFCLHTHLHKTAAVLLNGILELKAFAVRFLRVCRDAPYEGTMTRLNMGDCVFPSDLPFSYA